MRFLFPSVIHDWQLSNFDQDLCIRLSRELKKENPKGVEKSNVGGWQSDYIKFKKNDYFSNLISHTVRNYLREINIYKELQLVFDGYWVNINQPGALNSMHDHPGCDLAGVIWIKTDKKSGIIKFRHPNHFAEHASFCFYEEDFKKKNNIYPAFWIHPKPGYCILFPSQLDHWVEENKSTEDRISISFNIELKKQQ